MHEYFNRDTGKQNIYLLYGLGGAGKTQIALKYIQESESRQVFSHRCIELHSEVVPSFSDVLLIDASTRDTIETALKNIAATRNIGKTPQDALQWLRCKAAPWLLLFDNADDPKLNLNDFLPLCNHGNIVITSRNPELRVYAGSSSIVSDMETTDAVTLLLTSAKEENISTNQEIAAEIVKVSLHSEQR
jgi:DNA polymerase III delta prime subunit